MSERIRLMIADDHAIMREGLKQIFALDDTIEVVCEAPDSGQVLERLRQHDVDLLLLDISMPGMSGEDLITRLIPLYPQLRILVLSMFNEPQIARRVLNNGALAISLKTSRRRFYSKRSVPWRRDHAISITIWRRKLSFPTTRVIIVRRMRA